LTTPVCTYYISPECSRFRQVVVYTLDLISRGLEVCFRESDEAAAVVIFGDGPGQYGLDPKIYSALTEMRPCDPACVKGIHVYTDAARHRIDPIASIFYIIHCLGEIADTGGHRDRYGRVTFGGSVYGRFHDGYTDLVTPLMRGFLKNCAGMETISSRYRRQVVLSHDIDFLTSGVRQELRYLIQKPTIKLAGALIRHLLTGRKIWSNLEDIARIEQQRGFASVFYFLPEQRPGHGIRNADYSLQMLNKNVLKVAGYGMEVGLHKSSYPNSFTGEKDKIGVPVDSNRNHFLRYRLPDDWKLIEDAGFATDTGLGWSDAPGLRNGYPLDFRPFGRKLTVVPLVLMDTVFDRSEADTDMVETFRTMTAQWHDGYCVSILFHNNYLTPWSNQRFLRQYEKLLDYLSEEGIEVVLPSYWSEKNTVDLCTS